MKKKIESVETTTDKNYEAFLSESREILADSKRVLEKIEQYIDWDRSGVTGALIVSSPVGSRGSNSGS